MEAESAGLFLSAKSSDSRPSRRASTFSGLGLGRGAGEPYRWKGHKARGIGQSYYNLLTRHFGIGLVF